jgi:hypothetical protein
MEHCVEHAKKVFGEGCRALVLGHFHEERHIPCGERDGSPLGIYVLPAWRLGHRELVIEEGASPRFEDSRL